MLNASLLFLQTTVQVVLVLIPLSNFCNWTDFCDNLKVLSVKIFPFYLIRAPLVYFCSEPFTLFAFSFKLHLNIFQDCSDVFFFLGLRFLLLMTYHRSNNRETLS